MVPPLEGRVGMETGNPVFSHIGKTVTQDVYNRFGLLLIPAGTVLRVTDVELLRAHQIDSIETADSREHDTPLREASYLYQSTLEQTKQLFSHITESSIPPLPKFNEAFFPLLSNALKHSGLLRLFYLREGSEDYTYRHSIHVGILSALIGKLLNLSPDDIILLGQAGLLHDVGKVLIPLDILLKPSPLTPFEFEHMKQHTTLGAALIHNMDGASRVIALSALLHHERLDGSGYPEGRTGDLIPLMAKIVSVADVFDAICSDRVYKKGISPFDGAAVLWQLCCEGKVNPDIVIPFIRYISQLYVGSQAVLNSGERVEVIMVHTDEPLRPLVRKGEVYLDLRQHRSLSITQVIG